MRVIHFGCDIAFGACRAGKRDLGLGHNKFLMKNQISRSAGQFGTVDTLLVF